MQGRSWFGPPQVRDGPVDPNLSSSRFVLQLRLHPNFLEGDDLCLELVVVLFQCLLISRHYRGRELLVSDRDLTGSIAPSCL